MSLRSQGTSAKKPDSKEVDTEDDKMSAEAAKKSSEGSEKSSEATPMEEEPKPPPKPTLMFVGRRSEGGVAYGANPNPKP